MLLGGEVSDLVALREHDRVARRTAREDACREVLSQFGDRGRVIDPQSFLGEVESLQRNDERVGDHGSTRYVKGHSVLLSRDDVAIGFARPRTGVARAWRDRRRYRRGRTRRTGRSDGPWGGGAHERVS